MPASKLPAQAQSTSPLSQWASILSRTYVNSAETCHLAPVPALSECASRSSGMHPMISSSSLNRWLQRPVQHVISRRWLQLVQEGEIVCWHGPLFQDLPLLGSAVRFHEAWTNEFATAAFPTSQSNRRVAPAAPVLDDRRRRELSLLRHDGRTVLLFETGSRLLMHPDYCRGCGVFRYAAFCGLVPGPDFSSKLSHGSIGTRATR